VATTGSGRRTRESAELDEILGLARAAAR
jgi:hypothetical protein